MGRIIARWCVPPIDMITVNGVELSKEQMDAIVHLQFRGVKWDFTTIKTAEGDDITLSGKLDGQRIDASIKDNGDMSHKRYSV